MFSAFDSILHASYEREHLARLVREGDALEFYATSQYRHPMDRLFFAYPTVVGSAEYIKRQEDRAERQRRINAAYERLLDDVEWEDGK